MEAIFTEASGRIGRAGTCRATSGGHLPAAAAAPPDTEAGKENGAWWEREVEDKWVTFLCVCVPEGEAGKCRLMLEKWPYSIIKMIHKHSACFQLSFLCVKGSFLITQEIAEKLPYSLCLASLWSERYLRENVIKLLRICCHLFMVLTIHCLLLSVQFSIVICNVILSRNPSARLVFKDYR